MSTDQVIIMKGNLLEYLVETTGSTELIIIYGDELPTELGQKQPNLYIKINKYVKMNGRLI